MAGHGLHLNDEQFVQFFSSETSSQSLAIPLRFNRYLADPLPNTVELVVCGGRRSWMVRLKKIGEQVFIRDGWENFVKENNLEDGKLLNFIYDCQTTFRVIIFGHNRCSEFSDFHQVVVDVDDYDDGGLWEEEDKH